MKKDKKNRKKDNNNYDNSNGCMTGYKRGEVKENLMRPFVVIGFFMQILNVCVYSCILLQYI